MIATALGVLLGLLIALLVDCALSWMICLAAVGFGHPLPFWPVVISVAVFFLLTYSVRSGSRRSS